MRQMLECFESCFIPNSFWIMFLSAQNEYISSIFERMPKVIFNF
jgi:hypothetical protein